MKPLSKSLLTKQRIEWNKGKKLAAYIMKLKGFKIEKEEHYTHMGAIITDAILQAGINYKTVVKPRVMKVLNYKRAETTTGFYNLLKDMGPKKLLRWNHPEKPKRIMHVVLFLKKEGIETKRQLKAWLMEETNIIKLKGVRGVGDKTADYFKILCGSQAIAIDRHLMKFLIIAGISVHGYSEAKKIIEKTAEYMEINQTSLDYSIWKYMADKTGIKT